MGLSDDLITAVKLNMPIVQYPYNDDFNLTFLSNYEKALGIQKKSKLEPLKINENLTIEQFKVPLL